MNSPLVSIIVSNLNGRSLKLLGDCIDSLLKTDYKNWELIVVDNASTDDSVRYLQKRFEKIDNCRVVKNPVNMYSQGLNLGAQIAKGDYLAYFNNDVALKKGYFQEIIKRFLRDKKLAIAQGLLLNFFDHNLVDSAGETMDVYGNPITIGAGEENKGQYNKEEEILSASGSACIIKRDIFEEIGGYDPEYGIGYEDMDLALRARRLGYKVKRIPNAVVYHKRASTDLANFIRVKVKWHFNKNRLCTMIKNYPNTLLFRTMPITLILYFGITLYELAIKNNWNFAKVRITSIFWTILNLPNIVKKRQKIAKLGAKSLSQKDLSLFSPKTISELFHDFVMS